MYINPESSRSMPATQRISTVLSTLHASALSMPGHLEKRQFGYGFGYYDDNNSGWSRYGRWILLGVIVGLAVLIWLSVCLCNRQRTRTGMQPVKYTGWATPYQHPQQTGVVQNPEYSQYPMQQYPQNNNTYAPGYDAANNHAYGDTAPPIHAGQETYSPPSYPANHPTYPDQAAMREK